jgi:hypothetical protein
MARKPRAPLDELDLALVNALQISPRAPWTEVATALEVDAATVARRWQQAGSGTGAIGRTGNLSRSAEAIAVIVTSIAFTREGVARARLALR